MIIFLLYFIELFVYILCFNLRASILAILKNYLYLYIYFHSHMMCVDQMIKTKYNIDISFKL